MTFWCHINRSRHKRWSMKKAALRNFAKFTGKQCFPVKFAKFLINILEHLRTTDSVLTQFQTCQKAATTGIL